MKTIYGAFSYKRKMTAKVVLESNANNVVFIEEKDSEHAVILGNSRKLVHAYNHSLFLEMEYYAFA